METPSIEEQLHRLNKLQKKIWWLRCEGLDYEEIGLKLNFSMATIQKYASLAYQKLDFDPTIPSARRTKIVKETYCPVLHQLYASLEEIEAEEEIKATVEPAVPAIEPNESAVEPVEPNVEPTGAPVQPDIQPSTVWLMVVEQEFQEEQERRLAKRPETRIQIIKPERPFIIDPPHKINWWRIIEFLIVVAVGIAAIWYFTRPQKVVYVPTSPTATAGASAATHAATAVPTKAQSPTVSPPVFSDNFDNGLSDQWTVESGKPVFVGGQLTSDNGLLLSVGDPGWTDYQVEVTVQNWQAWIMVGLGVHGTGPGSMMMARGDCGYLNWWNLAPGSGEKKIDHTTFTLPCGVSRFVVSTQGNSYWAEGQPKLIYEGHPSGKVYLSLGGGTIVDNFKISPLP